MKATLFLVAAWAAAALTLPAAATPMVDFFSTGPAKWTTVINVYIPLDPARDETDDENKRTRHIQVKEAVDEWQRVATGQGAGLTINAVTLGADGKIPGTGKEPDPNVPGTVIVKWDESTTQPGHATPLVSGVPTGRKVMDPTTRQQVDLLKDQEYVSSTIKLSKNITAGEEQDNKKARAIMLHEMGHALGLAHTEETDSVLQDTLEEYVDKTKPGASDARELKSTYAAAPARMEDSVLPEGPGFRYDYVVEWLGGGEHALAQVVLFGVPVTDIRVPLGWEVVPGTLPSILSVRLAPTDDLQAYLNASNPILEFSFLSSFGPGETLAWAGESKTVIGPVRILEPPLGWLFGLLSIWLASKARTATNGRLNARKNPARRFSPISLNAKPNTMATTPPVASRLAAKPWNPMTPRASKIPAKTIAQATSRSRKRILPVDLAIRRRT